MNLCFYTFTFLPTIGGAEFLLHRLAESLTQRGHRVTVWAPYVSRKRNRLKTSYRLRRYIRPTSKRFGVRQPLVNLMWDQLLCKFDLIHCHGAYPEGYVGAAFKKWCRKPLVIRPHGSDILPGEWIRKEPMLERRMIDSLIAADAIIAQGRGIGDELETLGVPSSKVHIIHNGVVRPPARPPLAATEPPYLFSMGSLSAKKGYDVLLHAFAMLASQFPDLRLYVAGGGSRHLELVDIAGRLSLTDRVRWLGEIQDDRKSVFLSGAAAYVCPSRREPFSNALLEAMAVGLPIVATNVGGNTEMLEGGDSALLVPPEDPHELAAAIAKLLRDPDLRSRLGDGAYRRAEQFEWERMVDAYETLYRETIQA